MAGFKYLIIDDGAVSLWSFDGDQFDPTSRLLVVPTGEPPVIMDEIGGNSALLINADDLYPGYRMGVPSLVFNEQTDQYSICFGAYGKQTAYPGGTPAGFPKAYLEAPDCDLYNFPDYFGSFTVEFVFKMPSVGNYRESNLRPIISKQGIFKVEIVPYGTLLKVYHPGSVTPVSINMTNIEGSYDLFNNTIHFALVWEVKENLFDQYEGTASVYINGNLISFQTYSYAIPPVTNNTNSIFIGGTPTGNNNTDRHTSPFYIDQIAIYNIPLSADKVSRHVNKLVPYFDVIKYQFATDCWTLSELSPNPTKKALPYVGTLQGEYFGEENEKIFYNQMGPTNIPELKSVKFQNGGCLEIININPSYHYYIPNTINNEYSYEFWFAITSNTRGVIMSAQDLKYPYNGLRIEINAQNDSFLSGSIQFSESGPGGAVVLNSKFLDENQERKSYNDGEWHHLVILRKASTELQLWIDAILQDSKFQSPITVSYPGQLVFMNSLPGGLHVDGNLAGIAKYTYPMAENIIKSRWAFSKNYRIRGVVTLFGIPYQAKLRFYNSLTGQLIQEMLSDENTGEYMAIFYNNARIDLLVFNPDDLSIRYRAYGPIQPSEYDDIPINL